MPSAGSNLPTTSVPTGDPPSGERVGAGLSPPPSRGLPPPPLPTLQMVIDRDLYDNVLPMTSISNDDERAMRARRRDDLLRSVGAKR